MSGIKFVEGGVVAAKGFYANGIHCGIRKNKNKKDLALIFSDGLCDSAAVYTQNLVKGAPIYITQDNLSNGKAQAIICNSGIANTCNADGIEKAAAVVDIAAKSLDINPKDIIVASTGVIGQPLPLEPIESGMDILAKGLDSNNENSLSACEAIMTTDTRIKQKAVEAEIDGKICHIGGITKGSGMINPNMATMLCFVTTDVNISSDILQESLNKAVKVSFNCLSIDGDTSTNDMVSIMASGKAGNNRIINNNKNFDIFTQALSTLFIQLAKEMAKDGEGATKMIECKVSGASSEDSAITIAKSVINSNLVKTAMFGSDANWGRILCAIGYSGENINITKTDVAFQSFNGRIEVFKNGSGVTFDEEKAKNILSCDEILIDIVLQEGTFCAASYGCDLSYDYIKINGDYRT